MCFTKLMILASVACMGTMFMELPAVAQNGDARVSRVMLLSIDGLHAADLARYTAAYPNSNLAQLTSHGRTYTNARTTAPSDSFPGMLAMVTGGTPRSTGVYYDDGWDRTLAPATGPCTPGARVQWKQNLDTTPLSFTDALDPAKLPRNPADGCATRVFPHQFPRVNNIFELVKAAGGHTAWSDKHPSYEFLNGPSGTGLDDLYTPEIATVIGPLGVVTNSFSDTIAYDDMKVAVVLGWIKGLDHTGGAFNVPTLFGMNFQAVSVGQKLAQAAGPVGGYTDASGTPSFSLQATLDHTDASIGLMLDALRGAGLLESTLIIVTAKHGNSPVDPKSLVVIDPAKISDLVNGVQAGLLAQLSADTGPLIWLTDQTKTAAVVAALEASRAGKNDLRIDRIASGAALAERYADPATDSRVPDIILYPLPGTLYTTTATKIADHGGASADDTNVGLLVSHSSFSRKTIGDPVETRQIACTILKALSLKCKALESHKIEPIGELPKSNHANVDQDQD